MPTRRCDLVVFDFDGTLADTFAGIERCINLALCHFGFPLVTPQTLRPTIGLSLEVVFRSVIDTEVPQRRIADLIDVYRQRYPREAPPLTTLFPGVLTLLQTLTRQGRSLAVATSKASSNILPILDALGLLGYFEVICSDDLVQKGKPHPDMLYYIAERMNVPPEWMLVVGDTRFDIEMGDQAGATTCAVTWGNHSRDQLAAVSPTYLVDTVGELEDVIHRTVSI